jgi:KUP system potassium uptake protein
VIASQAVITGAFSVARQAVQLGYLPRLRIVHTSAQTIGQIYVPYVNWALLVMVIVLVLSFRTSAALAYAFGMAVTGTILITTLLIFYVAWRQWGWPLWVVVPVGGAVLGFEALLLAANLTKIPSGAWLPLVIAVVVLRGGVGTDGSPAPGSATPATTTATTSCSRACAGPADHPV